MIWRNTIRKARDNSKCSVQTIGEKGVASSYGTDRDAHGLRVTVLETFGHQSMNMKPPIIPPSTMRRPYLPPNPRARAWIWAEATLFAVDDPPKPVNVLLAEEPPVLVPLLLEVVVAAMVEIVEVLTRTGFCAPQGLSERQALWQDVSVCSHLLTQLVAAWVHS